MDRNTTLLVVGLAGLGGLAAILALGQGPGPPGPPPGPRCPDPAQAGIDMQLQGPSGQVCVWAMEGPGFSRCITHPIIRTPLCLQKGTLYAFIANPRPPGQFDHWEGPGGITSTERGVQVRPTDDGYIKAVFV